MMRTEREKKEETKKKKKNMCIKRNVHAIYVWWQSAEIDWTE